MDETNTAEQVELWRGSLSVGDRQWQDFAEACDDTDSNPLVVCFDCYLDGVRISAEEIKGNHIPLTFEVFGDDKDDRRVVLESHKGTLTVPDGMSDLQEAMEKVRRLAMSFEEGVDGNLPGFPHDLADEYGWQEPYLGNREHADDEADSDFSDWLSERLDDAEKMVPVLLELMSGDIDNTYEVIVRIDKAGEEIVKAGMAVKESEDVVRKANSGRDMAEWHHRQLIERARQAKRERDAKAQEAVSGAEAEGKSSTDTPQASDG